MSLLNTGEAACYLRLKRCTLNKWRVQGVGPKFVKIGRLVYYKQESLDDYLLSRERCSTSDRVA